MRWNRGMFGIGAALALAGCGGGGDSGEEAEDSAPTTMQEAMEQANDAMRNMPGMGSNANPNAPTFTADQLRDRMPESAGGLNRTELNVTTSGMAGMNVVNVQATYRGEEAASVEVSITDVGSMPGMAMASAAWTMATFDRQTETGFERTMRYEGYQAMETQNTQGGVIDSSLNVLAGNYLVQLVGRNVDLDGVKDLADDLDIPELGG